MKSITKSSCLNNTHTQTSREHIFLYIYIYIYTGDVDKTVGFIYVMEKFSRKPLLSSQLKF